MESDDATARFRSLTADDSDYEQRLSATEARLFGELPAERRVGRYRLKDKLGRGSMGVVYRAHDEQLDRAVAVKILNVSGTSSGSNSLEEARALAKLSHQNIVHVYESGMAGERVYIVMELVEGEDLASWIQRLEKPDWRTCLRAYLQAGAGLAAAHAQNIVHGDFKPANVIVDDVGRVRVLDFGLARRLERGTTDGGSEVDGVAASASGQRVFGTPAYMSPEQMLGECVGEKADQFSFCVAPYESLYGTRPFEGETLGQLSRSITEGQVRSEREGRSVPSRLRRIVLRGLSPDPDERWPSMEFLLGELRSLVEPKSRLPLAIGLSVGMAFVGLGLYYHADHAGRCEGFALMLEGVWGDAERAETKEVILGTSVPHAVEIWGDFVEPTLDNYALRWVDQRRDACEATNFRGDQSSEVMDLRIICLGDARRSFSATVDVLKLADESVVDNAHHLIGDLPRLSRCSDIETLRRDWWSEQVDVAGLFTEVKEALAAARAERQAGRHELAKDAIAASRAALSEESPDWLRMSIDLEEGWLLKSQGLYDESEDLFRKVLLDASRGPAKAQLREASVALLHLVGVEQMRPVEADRYRELAIGLASGNALAEARAQSVLANIHALMGELPIAEEMHRKVVATRVRALGSAHPLVADARANLAVVLRRSKNYDEAEAESRAVLEVRKSVLGEAHPETARAHNALAIVLRVRGSYEESLREHQQARELLSRRLESSHPELGATWSGIGLTLRQLGRYDDAEAAHRMAVDVLVESLGSDHPKVAAARNNLGATLRKMGKFAEAERQHRSAVRIYETRLGKPHPSVASALNNLGLVLQETGEYERAAVAYRRALDIRRGAFGGAYPGSASVNNNLGIVLDLQGNHEEAVFAYQLALEIWRETLGPKHKNVLAARQNLCIGLFNLKRHSEAKDECRMSYQITKEVLGEDHPSTVTARSNLAAVLFSLGELSNAESEFREVLNARIRVLGPEHPLVADSMLNLTEVLLKEGRRDESLATAERLWDELHQNDAVSLTRTRAAFALARARWESAPNDRARHHAVKIAKNALELASSIEDLPDELRVEMDDWLATHSTAKAGF